MINLYKKLRNVFKGGGRVDETTHIPHTTYLELQEHTMRTIMECKVGRTFPCILSLDTQHVEITVYENHKLTKKRIYAEDFIVSIHPKERTEYLKHVEHLLQNTHSTLQCTFRSRCLTGSTYRWYELLGEVMYSDQTGAPIKYVGVMRDIDEKQKNEQELKQSAGFLQQMYRNLPVGIIIYDKDGQCINCNIRALEIFGIDTNESVRGLSIFNDPGLPIDFKEALFCKKEVNMSIKYDFDKVKEYFHSSRSGVIELLSKGVPMIDTSDQLSYYLVVHLDDTEKVNARDQIRDFENYFSAIAGFAHVGYCKWDLIQEKGFAIDQWYLNLDESPEVRLDSYVEQYKHISAEDRTKIANDITRMRQGELTSMQHEVAILNEDGTPKRWLYINIIVTKYEPQNDCLEIMGINIEISNLKTVETQLIQANNQATQLIAQRDMVLNNLSTGLVYIDTNFRVQWVTTSAIRSLFSKESYLPGNICYRSAYGRETPCENCPLERMMTSLKPETLQIDQCGTTIEILANPVFDHQDHFLGAVIRLEDISARKNSERKIKELNHLMDAILNNIPVFLFVKDPNNNFRYLYWNKAMSEHTCIPMEHVIGKTDRETFPNMTDADRFREDDLRLLDGGMPIEFEEQFTDADGNQHVTHTLKTLIHSEDKLPWVMGVSWDITDLKNNEAELIKAKEKAEESDRFKSSFLANMSHEIRTPLNAIVGFSELLTDESTDNEDRTEYLTIIQKNNQLLLQLISDILDLSRIEARVLELNYDLVDLHGLCSRIATSCGMRPEIKVPIIFDETQPEYFVQSDENRVNQVITNFVTNAIKFTDTGSITIGYQLRSQSEIEIYVQDTGTGIPDDKMEAVFDRFVKLNSFVQGTGLGLSICKNLVEQFGGKIGVESQEGVGARFWFTLPFDSQIRLENE